MNQYEKRKLKEIPFQEPVPTKSVRKVLIDTVKIESEPPVEVSHHGSNGDDFLTEGLE